jgi:hypothetical protein
MKSRFLLTRVGDSCFFYALDSGVLANKNNKKLMPNARFAFSVEALPMANNLIPLFLSDHTEEPEQPVIGKAWHRAAISSRILKTSILVVTAAAIVFAVLSKGNPLVRFTNATASLVGTSAPQDGAQSTPTIQSTADAQALPPTAREAPTGAEIAAAFNSAYQSQTENPQPPAEAVFKQFQAWAAEEDAQVRPVQSVQDAQQPQVQDDQARVANARAEVRPVKNARAHVRSEHDARAKVRHLKNAQARMRREQNTQAQVQPVQNAQPAGLLQSLGLKDK